MVDYRKRCILSLQPVKRGLKPFELIIYGRSASELMTVPNETIRSLVRRYPNYQGSMFLIRDVPDFDFSTGG